MLFSRTGAGLCIYRLLVWSNLNFLHVSLCLVVYTFCADLLHSLIIIIISLELFTSVLADGFSQDSE